MKLTWSLVLLATLAAPLGCDYAAVHLSFSSGELVVFVHYPDYGVEGVPLEIVETGDNATTDGSGLARFTLPPGTYTVRAYGLRRAGPCCGHIDSVIRVDSGEEARIDIWDCLTCQ